MSLIPVSCPTHPDYFITNICTLQACIEPLCPECIPKHIKQHTSLGQVPQIENIQTIKNQQKSLIFEILSKLKEQSFLLNNKDTKLFIQQGLEKIQKAKQEILKIIDNIFVNYENDFKNQAQSIVITKDDALVEILNTQIAKMEKLSTQLGNQEYVKAILQTYIEGIGPSVYQKIEKECSELFEQFPSVIINQTMLQSIKYNIETYISIRKGAFQSTIKRNLGEGTKENQNEIVKKLVGDNQSNPSNSQQIAKQLVNTVYMSKNDQRGSFMPPKFVQNASDLESIDLPFKPLTIVGGQQEQPYLISFFEDQKKAFMYTIENTTQQYYLTQQQQQNINRFEEIQLNIERRIAVGHKCIQYGKDILLIGGIERDVDRNSSIGNVYKYKDKTLIHHSTMVHRRQGCGACVVEDVIFVCGGSYTDLEDSSINGMERFDGGKWTPLRSCRKAVTYLNLCQINNEFLIKIGGIDNEFNRISDIEVYSIRQNNWFDLDIFDQSGHKWIDIPINMGCIQINKNELFIFGGQIDNEFIDNSWVINLDISNGVSIRSSIIKKVQSIPCVGCIDFVKLYKDEVFCIVSEGAKLMGGRKRVMNGKSESKWSVTEKLKDKDEDYKKSIITICNFESLEELSYLMKYTIYGKVTDLFAEPQKQKIFLHFNNPNQKVEIEALQLFKNDIKPWWEDPANEKGGHVKFEIFSKYYDAYNNIYKDILFNIIGESDDVYKHVNGIRVIDRISFIRFEIWLDFDPKEEDKQEKLNKLEHMLATVCDNLKIEKISIGLVPHKTTKQ